MADATARDEQRVIAIDIGGGTTKMALVDRHGSIHNRLSFPTLAASGGDFVEKLSAAARELQLSSALPIVGISIAVAGFVNPQGDMEYNSNLPWLEGTPLASVLARELRLPIVADTDSNAACVAEYLFGQGQGSRRFLCLTGGTGLGVGMIIDGRLVRIAHGCMGDAGHVIVAPNGPACSCGGHGCAEALLSTVALADRYTRISGRTGFRRLVEDARADEPAARRILEEAGRWLGIAAASLACIFLPDRIAIAGGLSHAGDDLLTAAQASFRDHCGHFPASRASLVRADKGEHSTLLGAAASFFNPQLL